MKVFVGGSSSDSLDEIYYNGGYQIASYLANKGYNLITGGSRGMIKKIQDVFSEFDRNITIMEALPYMQSSYDYYVSNYDTIFERKSALINNADLIIFLPGGIGTFDEIFTAIEGKRAREYDVPIIIINVNNYYDNLVSLLDNMYNEKFANLIDSNLYYIASDVEDAIKYIDELGDDNENK